MPTLPRHSQRWPTVVHLSSVHTPGDVRILLKECRTLAEQGYDVAFAVPAEADAVADGVEILAVPRPRNRLQRMLVTTRQVARRAERRGADIVHFHDPELMPVAWYLKLKGRRVVMDVHENLPNQILDKAWIPRRLRRPVAAIAGALEWLTARTVDAVAAATPAIAQRFPAGKTVLVQNFPLLGELAAAKATPYANRPPWVAYVGGITAIRGAREMVRAMDLLDPALGARLRLAGAVQPPQLADQLAQEPGWRCVDALGHVPRSVVAEALAAARCGLVLFQPAANHFEAQPNKLFEYMSAGLPLIASDFPLWREVVEGSGAGVLVDPRDPAQIAEAITWILNHPEQAAEMGRRGCEAVQVRYNWEREAEILKACYQRLSTP